LNLTPDQVAALPPEFQAVIRALNATRPTGFFFERPPVYRVRVWVWGVLPAEYECDWCLVRVHVHTLDATPWNFTPWFYASPYLSYYRYYIGTVKGLLGALSSAFPLAVFGLWTLLVGTAATAFVVAAAGGPGSSLIRGLVRRSFILGRQFAYALSRPLRRLVGFLSERLKSRLRLRVLREVTRVTGLSMREYERMGLRERARIWTAYLKARGLRQRMAHAAAWAAQIAGKAVEYRSRAAHVKLLADIARSERVRRIATCLETWPYGVRRKMLRGIGHLVEPPTLRALAWWRLHSVIGRPRVDVSVRLGILDEGASRQYLLATARRLADDALNRAAARLGEEVRDWEMLRARLRGAREVDPAAKYLMGAAIIESTAPTLAVKALQMGGEGLLAVASALLSGVRVAPEEAVGLYDLWASGRSEEAYQKAVAYLNVAAASEVLRAGSIPRDVERALAAESREGVVKAASDLAARHLEEGWTPHYALVLRKEDVPLIPQLYRGVATGALDRFEALAVARGYADFLINVSPEEFGFLREWDGDRLLIAVSALSSPRPEDTEVMGLLKKDVLGAEDYATALHWLNWAAFGDLYALGYTELEYLYGEPDPGRLARSVAMEAVARQVRAAERAIEAHLAREFQERLEEAQYFLGNACEYLEEAAQTGDEDLLRAAVRLLKQAERAANDAARALRSSEVEHLAAEIHSIVESIEEFLRRGEGEE
ncbi:MAG: hypothetical protein DRJ56_06810, partial [Thermoprotei archaeon]